jgi:hypothetical protein
VARLSSAISGPFNAYRAWPAVNLVDPILLMGAAIVVYRVNLATRLMPFAGIVGVVVAMVLTVWPEYQRLAPYVGSAPLLDVRRALDLGARSRLALSRPSLAYA